MPRRRGAKRRDLQSRRTGAGVAPARRGAENRSDTEVILRLYEREGIGCLSKLNGMFASRSTTHGQMLCTWCVDRIGVKPLYVADDGQRMLFGSEIKQLCL